MFIGKAQLEDPQFLLSVPLYVANGEFIKASRRVGFSSKDYDNMHALVLDKTPLFPIIVTLIIVLDEDLKGGQVPPTLSRVAG